MAVLRNGSKLLLITPKGGTPVFHRFGPPILGISQSSTCFLLNPNIIFEIGSKIIARFYSSIDFAGGCLIFFTSKALPSTVKVVTE